MLDRCECFRIKDGKQIYSGRRAEIREDVGKTSLEFLSLAEIDEATYTCEISNAAGRAKTEGTVHVLVEPTVEVDARKSKMVVREGDSFKIRMSFSGLPKPKLTWLLNNQPCVDEEM